MAVNKNGSVPETIHRKRSWWKEQEEIGLLNLPPGLSGIVVHRLDGGSSQAPQESDRYG